MIEQKLKRIDHAAKGDQALFRDEDYDEFNTAPNTPPPLHAESLTPREKEEMPRQRKVTIKQPLLHIATGRGLP